MMYALWLPALPCIYFMLACSCVSLWQHINPRNVHILSFFPWMFWIASYICYIFICYLLLFCLFTATNYFFVDTCAQFMADLVANAEEVVALHNDGDVHDGATVLYALLFLFTIKILLWGSDRIPPSPLLQIIKKKINKKRNLKINFNQLRQKKIIIKKYGNA